MSTVKPFSIPQHLVWEAYRLVKSKGEAPGVDGQTMEDFEQNLERNLYRIWNRMSSGSYFPSPVKRVEIPKDSGGKRKLGIPTVTDRIAQTVVKFQLEPILEPHFHPDSYGYRPGKSTLDAVGQTRRRCWQYGWAVDLDIKGFFGNLDHELMLKAIYHHTTSAWHRLYIQRWLEAPVMAHGTLGPVRHRGTPQGGVISPLLANLFLHYAFDLWMGRSFPGVMFERYADDIVVHARSVTEAQTLQQAIGERLQACQLELHPDKTRIVLCKQWNREAQWPHIEFDFLSYSFRPRQTVNCRKERFTGFLPAVSKRALKRMRQEVRRWHLCRWSHRDIFAISAAFSSTIRGWMQYYGHYYGIVFDSMLAYINTAIARWACRKYKRFRGRLKRARQWIARLARRDPSLFPHWGNRISFVVGQ
jgi:RNA-directed DNA polymerase